MKFKLFGIKFNTLYVILIALVVLIISYFCLSSIRESFAVSNGQRVLDLLSAQYTQLPTDAEIESVLGGKYPPQFKKTLTQAIYALHQATYGVPVVIDKVNAAHEVYQTMTKERKDKLMSIVSPTNTEQNAASGDQPDVNNNAAFSMVVGETTAPVEITGTGDDQNVVLPDSPLLPPVNATTEGFSLLGPQVDMSNCGNSLKRLNDSLSYTIDAILKLKGDSADGSIPCGQDLSTLVKISDFDDNFEYFKTYCYAKAKPELVKLSGKLGEFPNFKKLTDDIIEYGDNIIMYLSNFRKEFDLSVKCVDPPNKNAGDTNPPVGAAGSAAAATQIPSPSNSTCSATSSVPAMRPSVCNNMQSTNQPPISCPAPVNTSRNAPCDNYNHYSNSSIPTMFYGPNGSVAKVGNAMNGRYTIVITNSQGENSVYNDNANNVESGPRPDTATYYGPQRTRAVFYTDQSGKKSIRVMYANGSTHSYTENNTEGYTNMKNGNQTTETTETIEVVDMGTMGNASNYNNAYDLSITSDEYKSSLPKGIPKYMIPPGQDDMYILKSEVVPPVCPACPPQILKCKDDNESDVSKCPPCPACARCPEPSFDCKKVPNYGSGNLGANYNNQNGAFGRMMSPDGGQLSLPQPVLNEYSTYGM